MNGLLRGRLRWPQLDSLWQRVLDQPQAWFVSQAGELSAHVAAGHPHLDAEVLFKPTGAVVTQYRATRPPPHELTARWRTGTVRGTHGRRISLMRNPSTSVRAATLVLAALVFAPAVQAASVRMIAQVTAIEVTADGQSAAVTVKNAKTGADVTVKVTDQVTLDKFAAKSIAPGDQVRLSYDDTGGGNLSKTFKKAGGC